MGTNSSKWDRDAHYAAMSLKELEAKRDWWVVQLEKNDYAGGHEELAHIRMLIAERIGKPKQ